MNKIIALPNNFDPGLKTQIVSWWLRDAISMF